MMNYFLELYHINEYFRRVSSMDAERIAAAESIGLEFSPIKRMVRNLIMSEIPEYYLHDSSEEGLSCEEIVNEVQKKGHLCRWRQRNGISKVKVDIEGEHFVIASDYKGGWNMQYGAFNTKMEGYELKDMSVMALIDMLEDIAAVPDSLPQLYKMYLDMICTGYGPEHRQDAEYFKDIPGTLSDGDVYFGLLAIAIDGPTKVHPIEGTPFQKRVEATRDGFKKHMKIKSLTDKLIEGMESTLWEEGLEDAPLINHTCFSSCILLLAPYGRKDAIIGTVDYSGLPHIKEILRQISTFKDGDTLPEGFRLLK